MFCKNCGAIVKDSENFCRQCGMSLKQNPIEFIKNQKLSDIKIPQFNNLASIKKIYATAVVFHILEIILWCSDTVNVTSSSGKVLAKHNIYEVFSNSGVLYYSVLTGIIISAVLCVIPIIANIKNNIKNYRIFINIPIFAVNYAGLTYIYLMLESSNRISPSLNGYLYIFIFIVLDILIFIILRKKNKTIKIQFDENTENQ